MRVLIADDDKELAQVLADSVTACGHEVVGTVSVSARHTGAEVDFEWHGTLQVGDCGRALDFAFEGNVLRDMEVCRLGLIVLHPVEELIDAAVTVKGPHWQQSLKIIRQVAPQRIVNGLPQAMTCC